MGLSTSYEVAVQALNGINALKVKTIAHTEAEGILPILSMFEALASKREFVKGREYLDICLDFLWEKLNTGTWREVDICWRSAYSFVSLLMACTFVVEAHERLIMAKSKGELGKDAFSCAEKCLVEGLKTCDRGLLMGKPIPEGTLNKLGTAIQETLSLLLESNSGCFGSCVCKTCENSNNSTCSEVSTPQDHPKRSRLSSSDTFNTNDSLGLPIIRIAQPALMEFHDNFMKAEKPVILTSCLSYWPALSCRRWSIEYLRKKAGFRTVPVEIGDKYTSGHWTQRLITLNEFISDFIHGTSTDVGYLAQHELFDQIPELKDDINVPDYCSLRLPNTTSEMGSRSDIEELQATCSTDLDHDRELEPTIGKGSNVNCGDALDSDDNIIINAWFGPQGTVSPLHHDPYHNLLAQVKGEKLIRLYDRRDSKCVYPYDDRLLFNTSQVDVESPDMERFPDFNKAKYWEIVLKEGEMLYIPPKWWHYVRSLTLSFSVSFWWT